jgi:hypothetical protein
MNELLEYCPSPLIIQEGIDMNKALEIIVENHGRYAVCYIKQAELVDAVRQIQ